MHEVLTHQQHRPWPLPDRKWVMYQEWCDLLFAHWPVPSEVLRGLVPRELELDLFDGEAWFGVVPFRMQNIHFRNLPRVPGLSAFPEFNLRTYVRVGDRPGVWFFSLDATSLVAVKTARAWFNLPYHHARMSCATNKDTVEYESQRIERGAGSPCFRANYRPVGEVERASTGSLEHWLTERYCLYAQRKDGTLSRGEIHHAPWPLQPAEVELELDEYPKNAGIVLPDRAPILHFARKLDVVVWSPQPV